MYRDSKQLQNLNLILQHKTVATKLAQYSNSVFEFKHSLFLSNAYFERYFSPSLIYSACILCFIALMFGEER